MFQGNNDPWQIDVSRMSFADRHDFESILDAAGLDPYWQDEDDTILRVYVPKSKHPADYVSIPAGCILNGPFHAL